MQDLLREAIQWMTRTQYSASPITKPEEVAFASTVLDYLYLCKWDGSAMQLAAVCYRFYLEQKQKVGGSDAALEATRMFRENIVEQALNAPVIGTSTVQTESTVTRVVTSPVSASKHISQ